MEVFEAALPALGQAWAMILQPEVLGYLLGGVVMGLAVGVFPGLGGIAGLSLDPSIYVRHGACIRIGSDDWYVGGGSYFGHFRLGFNGYSGQFGFTGNSLRRLPTR